jgi:hypothetical protein
MFKTMEIANLTSLSPCDIIAKNQPARESSQLNQKEKHAQQAAQVEAQ